MDIFFNLFFNPTTAETRADANSIPNLNKFRSISKKEAVVTQAVLWHNDIN